MRKEESVETPREIEGEIQEVMHRLCLAGEGVKALAIALDGWNGATEETRSGLRAAVQAAGYLVSDCRDKLEIIFQAIRLSRGGVRGGAMMSVDQHRHWLAKAREEITRARRRGLPGGSLSS